MAPSLEPCPCPKCNGALVSHRTVLRHAAADHINQPIPTFDEWIAAAPEQLDTGRASDGLSEGNYDGMDGIEDEQVIRERRLYEPLDVGKDCQVQYLPMKLNESVINICRKMTITVAPLPIADQYHQLPNIKLKIHQSHQIKNLKKRTSTRIKDYRRMMRRRNLILLKILGQIPQTQFQPNKRMIFMICLVLSMFVLLRSS